MNIFAVVKKAINSNLDKPLNITLDEIKADTGKVGKATRIVTLVKSVPNNATYNAQVLTLDDEALLSVNGSGRILHVLPLANLSGSMGRNGTALITVDDNVIFNNAIQFSFPSSDRQGYSIINQVGYTGNMSINTDSFGSLGSFYFTNSQQFRDDCSTFVASTSGIYAPSGIPFKNKFEIRLTQTMTTDIEKVGVFVVYELYE